MGIFGSAIGGALGIGGSIFGGITASKAMKKALKNVKNQLRENENWMDRRYNEDATQRADAQAALNYMREMYDARNRQAAGTAAVAGGTDESVAATKAANAASVADAISKVNSSADARKDAIEQQYMSNKSSLNKQLNNFEIQKSNSIAQAAKGVADASGKLATAFYPTSAIVDEVVNEEDK